MSRRGLHWVMVVCFVGLGLGIGPAALLGQGKSRAVREAAEYILRKFAKEAGEETVETLARRIERLAFKHGDEVIQLAKKGGPAAIHAVEEAGERAPRLLKFYAQHGENALWVISRPQSMTFFLKHGEDAGVALMRHGQVVEPVIEQWGTSGAKAFARITDSQQARRLAIMHNSGELAKIGRTEELFEVIAKKSEPGWADRVMDFIWRHKGALTVTAALAAFLAEPEAFINGVKDITQIAAENTVGKMAEGIAHSVNWTVIFLALLGVLGSLIGLRWYWHYRAGRQARL
ncbi:hypothetical protein HRbin36_01628 [bacterium HR36]|nr:hypothetical protein HRbin36_01628 [bacterium HR36]